MQTASRKNRTRSDSEPNAQTGAEHEREPNARTGVEHEREPNARTGVEHEREMQKRSGGPFLGTRYKLGLYAGAELFELCLYNKMGIPRDTHFLHKKSARRDSNPRPRPWQGRAPPTEPLAHMS